MNGAAFLPGIVFKIPYLDNVRLYMNSYSSDRWLLQPSSSQASRWKMRCTVALPFTLSYRSQVGCEVRDSSPAAEVFCT